MAVRCVYVIQIPLDIHLAHLVLLLLLPLSVESSGPGLAQGSGRRPAPKIVLLLGIRMLMGVGHARVTQRIQETPLVPLVVHFAPIGSWLGRCEVV